MDQNTNPDEYYVLGRQQQNNNVAILCRNSSPALYKTKKESIKARSRLLNDRRTLNNEHTLHVIQELRVYKIQKGELLMWHIGELWAYIDKKRLTQLEDL